MIFTPTSVLLTSLKTLDFSESDIIDCEGQHILAAVLDNNEVVSKLTYYIGECSQDFNEK